MYTNTVVCTVKQQYSTAQLHLLLTVYGLYISHPNLKSDPIQACPIYFRLTGPMVLPLLDYYSYQKCLACLVNHEHKIASNYIIKAVF